MIKKAIKIKEAWTTVNGLFLLWFRLYVQMAIQRLIGFGKKQSLGNFGNFKKQNTDGMGFCEICRVQRVKF